jgi:hypothetical protein
MVERKVSPSNPNPVVVLGPPVVEREDGVGHGRAIGSSAAAPDPTPGPVPSARLPGHLWGTFPTFPGTIQTGIIGVSVSPPAAPP